MFGKKNREEITGDSIKNALKNVKYPGFSRDIVSFGMIGGVGVKDGIVNITLQANARNPQTIEQVKTAIQKELTNLPGIKQVLITLEESPHASKHAAQAHEENGQKRKLIENVKFKIAVASGKGGVGKSTVSVNLAAALKLQGFRVGLFDCDIYGPSIPMMMKVEGRQPAMQNNKIVPIENYGIQLMSIGFFTPKDTPLIWRGPMIQKSLEQMLGDVDWGELDFLIIDLPPGTGDAQLSLAQLISLSGAVIVTTPQDISLIDAVKGVMMFNKINVPIIGIIENMSYFLCPHCGEETDIFSRGGGKRESERLNVPFLGEIPLVTAIREGGDSGMPWVLSGSDSPETEVYKNLAMNLVNAVESDLARGDGEDVTIKII